MLEVALVKADSSVPAVISSIIGEFSQIPNLKKNSAYHRYDSFLFFHNKFFNSALREIRMSNLNTTYLGTIG